MKLCQRQKHVHSSSQFKSRHEKHQKNLIKEIVTRKLIHQPHLNSFSLIFPYHFTVILLKYDLKAPHDHNSYQNPPKSPLNSRSLKEFQQEKHFHLPAEEDD